MKVIVRAKHELKDFDAETRKYRNVTCPCGKDVFKKFLPAFDERGIVEESSFCNCGIIYHWAYGNVVGEISDGVDWLLKRAEDARRDESSLTAVKRSLRELEEENKRYREALKFYADEKSWTRYNQQGNTEIDLDGGRLARKELEGAK